MQSYDVGRVTIWDGGVRCWGGTRLNASRWNNLASALSTRVTEGEGRGTDARDADRT